MADGIKKSGHDMRAGDHDPGPPDRTADHVARVRSWPPADGPADRRI